MRHPLLFTVLSLAVATTPAWAAQSGRTGRSSSAPARRVGGTAAPDKTTSDKADAAAPAKGDKVVAAGETEKLMGGKVEFTPPEGWTKSSKNSGPNKAAYVSSSGEGMLLIEVAPPAMKLGNGTADTIAQQLQAKRQKEKIKVQDIKAEPDERFDVRVRERFDRGGKTADQLHLYKNVGGQVLMATVNSLAEDEEQTRKIHAAGEDALLSAKYTGPQPKSATARKGGTERSSSAGGSRSGRTGK